MSNHHNQNRDRKHGNKNRGETIFSKGQQIELVFAEKNVDGRPRIVSYLTDGTLIRPKSKRFRPQPGKTYLCSVKFHQNGRGEFGLAMPTLPMTLSPEEWIPAEELKSCLVVTLTFNLRRKPDNSGERLIAFDDGRAVFPDTGTTVVAGKPTPCLLREAGNVAFALPLGIEEQKGGTGLVKLAEKIGEVMEEDLRYVVLKKAERKPGVTYPKAESDLVIKGEYKNVFEILSDAAAGFVVNESSSEDEITKAYRHKSRALHTDKVGQAFGGADKMPVQVKVTAQLFFDALGKAKENALELLARKQKRSEKRAAEPTANHGTTDAQKADKPKRDRKPRGERKDAAPKADAPQPAVVAPIEGAPVATVAAEAEKVEAPIAPAEPAPVVTETVAVEAKEESDAEAKDPELVEIETALELARKQPQYADLTIEQFLCKPEILKFYRRQAKVQIQRMAAAAKSGGGSSKSEVKGSAPKGDFKAQLAAKASEDKQ